MERKSYIDRISSYGCKYEATVANGHPRLQIEWYGCKGKIHSLSAKSLRLNRSYLLYA